MEKLGSYSCLNKQGKIRKLIELKQGFYKKKEDYSLKEVKQKHGGGSIDREISLKGISHGRKRT